MSFSLAYASRSSPCSPPLRLFRCREAPQRASATEIQLSYKDKKFDPAEISAPANTPIVIKLKNLDATAMEFESKTLKVEKWSPAPATPPSMSRAQKPGRYEFFDEYNGGRPRRARRKVHT